MLRDAATQLAPPNPAELAAPEVLRALLEAAPDALLLVDALGFIRYANARTRDLLEYEPSELLSRRLDALVADQSREEFWMVWVQHTSTRAGLALGRGPSLRLVTKGGKEVVAELALRALDSSEHHWTGVAIRDVAAKVALEHQLTGLQKTEALGNLAGAVAHDFNNILTAIGSFADLAYQAARSGSSVRANLEEVLTAAEQARLLTKKLLDFAIRRPVEPIVVDLNAIVRSTERMVDVLMTSKVHVARVLSPSSGYVRVDPGGIEQVLVNLCINARDAMPDGGTLTIETSIAVVSSDTAPRLGPDVALGAYAVLQVADTGTGMTEEVRRHAFEPFFTTKPPGSGSGLGLATCYGLVAQAGGFMTLHSELGRGTRVDVYLPQTSPLQTPSRADIPRTILIVEPDPTVRAIATRELGHAGLKPIAAKGWTEALDALRLQGGTIDLLLIDVGAPATDALELAARIRRLCPSVKPLFISQHERETLTSKGTAIGEHEFLRKPFGTTELLEKLSKLIGTP